MKRLDGAFKDAHNYITTCDTIDGEWSDPWYVNSSGFDPSLFHDDDGRKYFMNMQLNHRGPGTGGNPALASFDGILLQEWSPEAALTAPATPHGPFCAIGRETVIEEVVWRENWLYLAAGGQTPRVMVPSPVDVEPAPRVPLCWTLGGPLPPEFQWLRTPQTDRIFRQDPDALVLIGRESIGSWSEQALVARRQKDARYVAGTSVEFAPQAYWQAAGLTTYCNRHKFHAALATDGPRMGRVLSLMSWGAPTHVTDAVPSYWHGWSPDGWTLAYVGRRNGPFALFTCPLTGGAETCLTAAFDHVDGPDYALDGDWIWFNGERDGAVDLWRIRPDGADLPRMTDDARVNWFPHPSLDSCGFAFMRFVP